MYAQAERSKPHSGDSAERPALQQKTDAAQSLELVNNRPTAVSQRSMQEAANHSPQATQVKAIQSIANSSSLTRVMQLAAVTSTAKYGALLGDVSAKRLYLGSKSSPSAVMNNGINYSTGAYTSILVHLLNNGTNSKWVSTTTSLNLAKEYAGDTGFVYDCQGIVQHGMDANAAYAAHWNNGDEKADLKEVGKAARSATYPFAHQKEVSIWNEVDAASIKAAYTKVAGTWRRYKRGAYLKNSATLPQEVRDRLG